MNFKKIFKKEKPFTDDCAIGIRLKNGEIDIKVELSEDVEIETVGELIYSLVSGELITPILEEVVALLKAEGKEDDAKEICSIIKEKLEEQQEIALEEVKFDRPLVEPIDAIRKQITMYQQG